MLGLSFFKVNGDSMSPKIPHQSYILVHRLLMRYFICEGKRLLIQHKTYGLIVKKVALVDHHGFIWVKGENRKSLSVEQIGPVSRKQVVGLVVSVFPHYESKSVEN